MKKPELTDFYDESDPRGCSSSEYSLYIKALDDWTLNDSRGSYVLGETLVTGIVLTLKDGTKQYQELKPPIVYRRAEENNKNS